MQTADCNITVQPQAELDPRLFTWADQVGRGVARRQRTLSAEDVTQELLCYVLRERASVESRLARGEALVLRWMYDRANALVAKERERAYVEHGEYGPDHRYTTDVIKAVLDTAWHRGSESAITDADQREEVAVAVMDVLAVVKELDEADRVFLQARHRDGLKFSELADLYGWAGRSTAGHHHERIVSRIQYALNNGRS